MRRILCAVLAMLAMATLAAPAKASGPPIIQNSGPVGVDRLYITVDAVGTESTGFTAGQQLVYNAQIHNTSGSAQSAILLFWAFRPAPPGAGVSEVEMFESQTNVTAPPGTSTWSAASAIPADATTGDYYHLQVRVASPTATSTPQFYSIGDMWFSVGRRPTIGTESTRTEGEIVWLIEPYNDPDGDAAGFGFLGLESSSSAWPKTTVPFANPGPGRVYPDRIEYPFNLHCGTPSQMAEAWISFWVYDRIGLASPGGGRHSEAHIRCTPGSGTSPGTNPGTTPPSGATRYASLGDSFSAGEGLPTTDLVCHRSDLGYPALLSKAMGWTNPLLVACTGDVTDGILDWGGAPQGMSQNLPQAMSLDGTFARVTITIGGNDAGFVEVMKQCVQGTPAKGKWGCTKGEAGKKLVADTKMRIAALAGDPKAKDQRSPDDPDEQSRPIHSLESVYRGITDRAPNAQLYVANYPLLFGTNKDKLVTRYTKRSKGGKSVKHTVCVTKSLAGDEWSIDVEDAKVLNDLTQSANEAIAKAAKAAGATPVDARTYFKGHGLCDAEASWINGLKFKVTAEDGVKVVDPGSFHPTDNGQCAYENAFQDAIGLGGKVPDECLWERISNSVGSSPVTVPLDKNGELNVLDIESVGYATVYVAVHSRTIRRKVRLHPGLNHVRIRVARDFPAGRHRVVVRLRRGRGWQSYTKTIRVRKARRG